MRSEIRRVRTVLVGDSQSFEGLLVDVLRDLRVEVEVIAIGQPDLVFAVVREHDVFGVLKLANEAASGAHVVAVMPMRDERLAQRAILCGAGSVCSLDGPLDALRVALMQALARRALQGPGVDPRGLRRD